MAGAYSLFSTVICVLGLTLCGSALADDKDDAIAASAKFAKAITDGDLDATYKTTSPRFQANMTETAFKERTGMLRIQLNGPPKTWTVIGAQELSHLPANNEAGEFYYVRLRVVYSSMTLSDEFMLEKTGSMWAVLTFNPTVIPQQ